ncbi:MAG: hypothetical protein K6G22_14755 [Lachnospiraceae bacterium]|nr:hypothetical protein [Lachnospiraceae bacterium]
MKKQRWLIILTVLCLLFVTGCGSPSGKFYRYNESSGSYDDDDYFAFSGSSLTYHENGNVYSCEYKMNGDYIEIKLNYPGNPLDMTFDYDKNEGTLSTKYDIFKKK